MSGGSNHGATKVAPKQPETIKVRAMKACFVGRLYEPGEVFDAPRKELCDESGKLLPHFVEVDSKAKSERFDPVLTDNPYGAAPIERHVEQGS